MTCLPAMASFSFLTSCQSTQVSLAAEILGCQCFMHHMTGPGLREWDEHVIMTSLGKACHMARSKLAM